MFSAAVDIQGFQRFVTGLQNALIGTGQDGDLMQVVKSEARQLALEISSEIGPRTAERGEKSIEKDMRGVFREGPAAAFPASKRNGAGGDYGITWLYAGPTFLVGVRSEDMQTETNLGELRQAMRNIQQSGGRGAAWMRAGLGDKRARRGKQAIMLLDRIIIGRERYAQLKQILWNRVGRARASFAFTAKELGINRIPAFIARHLTAVKSDGTAIFRYRVEQQGVSGIEFGSRAPGIVSNPKMTAKIHNAIQNRGPKMNDKIKKILQGYTYDWNTGAVFRRHRGAEMLKQLEANEQLYDSLN